MIFCWQKPDMQLVNKTHCAIKVISFYDPQSDSSAYRESFAT